MDNPDAAMELTNIQPSLKIHHSKKPWYYYRKHYSRRKAGKHGKASASTSYGRSIVCSEPFSFKLSGSAETKEHSIQKPDRIRPSSSSMDPTSVSCRICSKTLRWKTNSLGDSVCGGEYVAVAVLDCGHLYHADCLEETTRLEERHDPSCPLCSGLLPKDVPTGHG